MLLLVYLMTLNVPILIDGLQRAIYNNTTYQKWSPCYESACP
jgi:hypothetical protein